MLFNVCALYIKIMNNENQTIHKSDDNLTIYGWNEKLNQLKQELRLEEAESSLGDKKELVELDKVL